MWLLSFMGETWINHCVHAHAHMLPHSRGALCIFPIGKYFLFFFFLSLLFFLLFNFCLFCLTSSLLWQKWEKKQKNVPLVTGSGLDGSERLGRTTLIHRVNLQGLLDHQRHWLLIWALTQKPPAAPLCSYIGTAVWTRPLAPSPSCWAAGCLFPERQSVSSAQSDTRSLHLGTLSHSKPQIWSDGDDWLASFGASHTHTPVSKATDSSLAQARAPPPRTCQGSSPFLLLEAESSQLWTRRAAPWLAAAGPSAQQLHHGTRRTIISLFQY